VSGDASEIRAPRDTEPVETPTMRRWQVWGTRAGVLFPVLIVLALLAAATLRHQQTLAIGAALARGDTPPVPVVTLPAFDGPPFSLAALRGHPVVLNFWASWCIPCRDEAPLIEEIWREVHSHGLIVLGVDTQDLESPARAFIKQYRITYPNVRDPDGSVGRLFGTTGVPETFFISADGRIFGKFPGAQVSRVAWHEAISGLLFGRARVP
jgi:cytochrome c biogenesis protein CcmG/thiol:disulfide interchange protein DsbE